MQFQVSGLPCYSNARKLLEEVRRVVEEEFAGVPPNPTMFAQHSRVSVSTLRKRLGGSFQVPWRKRVSTTACSGGEPPTKLKITFSYRVTQACGGERFSQGFYVSHGGTFRLGLVKRLFGGTWNSVMIGIGARSET